MQCCFVSGIRSFLKVNLLKELLNLRDKTAEVRIPHWISSIQRYNLDTESRTDFIQRSIFMRAEKLLRDEMQKVIDAECLKASADACRIVPAALGESIGDVAAVSVAADGIERIKR